MEKLPPCARLVMGSPWDDSQSVLSVVACPGIPVIAWRCSPPPRHRGTKMKRQCKGSLRGRDNPQVSFQQSSSNQIKFKNPFYFFERQLWGPVLVHTPHASNSQYWARLRLGVKKLWFSTWVAGNWDLGSFPAAFQELGVGSGKA